MDKFEAGMEAIKYLKEYPVGRRVAARLPDEVELMIGLVVAVYQAGIVTFAEAVPSPERLYGSRARRTITLVEEG